MKENKKIKTGTDLGEAVYLCNDCRRCETYCIFENKKVINNNRYARNLVFNEKSAPDKIYEIYDNYDLMDEKVRDFIKYFANLNNSTIREIKLQLT